MILLKTRRCLQTVCCGNWLVKIVFVEQLRQFRQVLTVGPLLWRHSLNIRSEPLQSQVGVCSLEIYIAINCRNIGMVVRNITYVNVWNISALHMSHARRTRLIKSSLQKPGCLFGWLVYSVDLFVWLTFVRMTFLFSWCLFVFWRLFVWLFDFLSIRIILQSVLLCLVD